MMIKVCLKPLSSPLQQMLSADSEHKLGAEIMQNVFWFNLLSLTSEACAGI